MSATPMTLKDARALLDDGTLTAVQLFDQVMSKVAFHDPQVQALVTCTEDYGRELAAKADARLASGERTPLLGIPVTVKDLVDVAGVRTTAGSKVLEDNVATTSAPVWARLEAAGAVLVGKVNTHEFAYGGTTAPTRNPANTEHMVGGSSGGPAAALAAGMCLGAVGSDTAGSIRIPSNLCGVAGLKPSRGLIPDAGVIPLAPSLDCVGPMARRVADLEPLLRVMADLKDAPRAAEPLTNVGLVRPPGPLAASVAEGLERAVETLRHQGVNVTEVEIIGFDQSVFDNFTMIGFEATPFHAQWADKRDLYTPYVRDRLADAERISGQEYLDAVAAADQLARHVDALLEDCDALLLPGVPFPAPKAYVDTVDIDGVFVDRDTGLCRNTAFANLTGHPALAVPAGLDGRLPVGVQLAGRRGQDLQLLAWGEALESGLPPGLPAYLRY